MLDMLQAIAAQAARRLADGADDAVEPQEVEARAALGPGRGRRVLVGVGGDVTTLAVFTFAERLCRVLAKEANSDESDERAMGEVLARFVAETLTSAFGPDALNQRVTLLPPLVSRSTVALSAYASQQPTSMSIDAPRGQMMISLIASLSGNIHSEIRGGRRLVCVDDDPLAHRLLGRLLKDTDFEVTGVTDATEALKRIVEDPPDVVLLDYEMPIMTGLMCLQRIRTKNKHLPVIMVTAHNSASIVKQCLAHGASGFLLKPYRVADLRKQIEHVLRRQEVSVA